MVNTVYVLGFAAVLAIAIALIVWRVRSSKTHRRKEAYRTMRAGGKRILKDNPNPKIRIENNTKNTIQLISGDKTKRCTNRYCEDVFDCQRGTYNTVILNPGEYNLTDFDTPGRENSNDVEKVTYGNMLCLPEGTNVTFYNNDGNIIYPIKNSCGTRDKYYSADTGNSWKPTDKWTTYIGRMVFT